METVQLVLLAIALSADAFSVSAVVGLHCRGLRRAFRITFHFGLFQSLFTLMGAMAGTLILPLIAQWDHWLVFVLLVFIGGRMALEGLRGKDQSEKVPPDLTRGMTMIGLSVAVSIDGLPALSVQLIPAVAVIGIITTLISILAWNIAGSISTRFRSTAEVIGGVVLIAIGVRTVLQHLQIF